MLSNTGVLTRQASALSSPSAAVRGGLPFGVGSPTLPSGLLGGGHTGGSDAYSASPTRAQSHSGAYGVTHQVCAGKLAAQYLFLVSESGECIDCVT